MNMVPGMVTSFWFTPTQAGKFDILCAQLCGVGHYNMRGYVIVEEQAAFDSWLAKQQTFAVAMAKAAQPAAADASTGGDLAAQGRALAQSKGCAACHSVDGGASVGPTWKGLFGSTQAFTDGSSATVDDAFLKREIEDPQARIVKGFGPVMPKLPVTDAEVAALTAYIHSLGSGTAAAPQGGK